MLAHLTAIAVRLGHLGYPVEIGRIGKPVPAQYVILSAPGWESPDEAPIGGAAGSLDAPVRIKCVATTTAGALIMAARVRDVLSPGPGRFLRLAIEGRAAEICWLRSEFAAVDDTFTLTDGTHPSVAVDTYRLHSERTTP